MPLFRLETNLPADKIPADLPAKLTQVIATSLGKPVEVRTNILSFNYQILSNYYASL